MVSISHIFLYATAVCFFLGKQTEMDVMLTVNCVRDDGKHRFHHTQIHNSFPSSVDIAHKSRWLKCAHKKNCSAHFVGAHCWQCSRVDAILDIFEFDIIM